MFAKQRRVQGTPKTLKLDLIVKSGNRVAEWQFLYLICTLVGHYHDSTRHIVHFLFEIFQLLPGHRSLEYLKQFAPFRQHLSYYPLPAPYFSRGAQGSAFTCSHFDVYNCAT